MNVKGKTVVLTGTLSALSREEAEAGLKKLGARVTGKTICVTGTLSVERDEREQLLRDGGARVTGSVSKKTDFLVVGVAAGSKVERAQELGVQTLTEKQVRKALGL